MSIYKDKRGNWHVRYMYHGKDNKKLVGTDKVQAQVIDSEIKNKLRLEQFTGLDVVRQAFSKRTFAEVAKDYMDGRANSKLSTHVSYQNILKNYLLPEFGNVKLLSIRESDVRKFQSSLSKRGLSPARVNNIVRLLSSVISQAVRDGEIKDNPCQHVDKVTVDRDVDPFTEEELRLILKHVDPYFLPLFTTLAYTGARPNEILALRWSDVDWQTNQIHISKGRVLGKEDKPKTTSSVRSVPILPQVAEQLRNLRNGHVVRSIADYVFVSKNGQPINKHLDRVWSKAVRAAGVRHRPCYNLRHSWASNCLLKGMSVTYVAKLLGHSTIDTVIKHYASWIEGNTSEEQKLYKVFAN